MGEEQKEMREMLAGLAAPVIDVLAARTAAIATPGLHDAQDEDEEPGAPQLRSRFAAGDFARLVRRSARALLKLKCAPGEAIAITGQDSPQGLALLLAAAGLGLECHMLAQDEALPLKARVLICAPPQKAHWQAQLAKQAPQARLATLSGHFEGSFFMLQMAQPEQPLPITPVDRPGTLRFGDETLAFGDLLAQARTIAEQQLQEAQALIFSLPLDAPASLAHALAALLTDKPIHWLAAARRGEQIRRCEPPETGTMVIITDAAGIDQLAAQRRWAQAVAEAKHIIV